MIIVPPLLDKARARGVPAVREDTRQRRWVAGENSSCSSSWRRGLSWRVARRVLGAYFRAGGLRWSVGPAVTWVARGHFLDAALPSCTRDGPLASMSICSAFPFPAPTPSSFATIWHDGCSARTELRVGGHVGQ